MFRRIVRRSLEENCAAISGQSQNTDTFQYFRRMPKKETAGIAAFFITIMRRTAEEREALLAAYCHELRDDDTMTTSHNQLYGIYYLLSALDDEHISGHSSP